MISSRDTRLNHGLCAAKNAAKKKLGRHSFHRRTASISPDKQLSALKGSGVKFRPKAFRDSLVSVRNYSPQHRASQTLFADKVAIAYQPATATPGRLGFQGTSDDRTSSISFRWPKWSASNGVGYRDSTETRRWMISA